MNETVIDEYKYVTSADKVIAVCHPSVSKLRGRIKIREPSGKLVEYIKAKKAIFDLKEEVIVFSNGESESAVSPDRFVDVINLLRILAGERPLSGDLVDIKYSIQHCAVYIAKESTLSEPRLVFVFPEDYMHFGIIAPRVVETKRWWFDGVTADLP